MPSFWDFDPIIAIVDVGFDIIRAVFPSWFPHGNLHPDVERENDERRIARDHTREMKDDVHAVRILLEGPGDAQHKPVRELLEGMRADIQENTSVNRELLSEIQGMRKDTQKGNGLLEKIHKETQGIREDIKEPDAFPQVVERLKKIDTILQEIQTACDKFPSVVEDAFSKVLERERTRPPPEL